MSAPEFGVVTQDGLGEGAAAGGEDAFAEGVEEELDRVGPAAVEGGAGGGGAAASGIAALVWAATVAAVPRAGTGKRGPAESLPRRLAYGSGKRKDAGPPGGDPASVKWGEGERTRSSGRPGPEPDC